MQIIPKQNTANHSSYFNERSDDSSSAIWVRHEFAHANLGDERLNQRLSALAEDFSAQPEASIPKATESWGQACAAYRFFDNGKVTMGNILASHQQNTGERMSRQSVVLAVQDTTWLNFSTHPETKGLGPLGSHSEKTIGLLLHNTLALNEGGIPLGLIDVQAWARDVDEREQSKHRDHRPIEEKESIKWIRSFDATTKVKEHLPSKTVVVNVGDRESDIYELFEMALNRENGPALLVRAQHNRPVDHEDKQLWNFLENRPIAGTLVVEVPRKKGQKARAATLSIHFGEVTLKAPRLRKKSAPLTLWGIFAEEIRPPKGVKPIQWRLLTTLPVFSIEAAIQKVRWYVVRWQIEVFHKILKSGCRIEDRQLGTAERLKRVVAVDLIVAWRILLLTKLGRETPKNSAADILAEHEWKALYCFLHKTAVPPDKSPTIREAIMMIARLGGFLARKRDGFPGSICLWRGLHRLNDIAATWLLFNSTKDVRNG